MSTMFSQVFLPIAPLGHFVELGNQHIHRTQTISLAPHAENITYAVADINRIISRNNHRISQPLRKCSELLLNNSFVPLNNVMFSLEQAEEAFLYMNESQHTRKVAISPLCYILSSNNPRI